MGGLGGGSTLYPEVTLEYRNDGDLLSMKQC